MEIWVYWGPESKTNALKTVCWFHHTDSKTLQRQNNLYLIVSTVHTDFRQSHFTMWLSSYHLQNIHSSPRNYSVPLNVIKTKNLMFCSTWLRNTIGEISKEGEWIQTDCAAVKIVESNTDIKQDNHHIACGKGIKFWCGRRKWTYLKEQCREIVRSMCALESDRSSFESQLCYLLAKWFLRTATVTVIFPATCTSLSVSGSTIRHSLTVPWEECYFRQCC